MSEFVRYTETHLLLTTHDAVALIDNAGDPAGALSAAVDLRGVRDFNLEVTYNGSGATDDFICSEASTGPSLVTPRHCSEKRSLRRRASRSSSGRCRNRPPR